MHLWQIWYRIHVGTLGGLFTRDTVVVCLSSAMPSVLGHVDILEWLFEHSLANGLERDDFDTTPVHDAAEEGQIDCLKIFHKYKVDLCCKDMDGFSPR